MYISIAIAALFAGACISSPVSIHTVHEKRATTPRLWRRGDRVDQEAILPIRIGLTQSNLEDAYDHLMEVSHPSSPNFGKHWTAQEVHDMYAPSKEAVHDVRAWLVASGINPQTIVHSDNKGWLAIEMTTRQAEELFKTEYHEYEHKQRQGRKVKVGCDEYQVPGHLARHIDYITPGVALSPSLIKRKVGNTKGGPGRHGGHPRPGPHSYTPPHSPNPFNPPPGYGGLPKDLQDCARNITPPCLRALYNIPKATLSDNVNMMGLYETGDKYSQEDLDLFYANYAPKIPKGTHPKLKGIDGGQAPVAPGDSDNTGESDIDMAIGFSLIYPQTITLYQVDDETQAYTDQGYNTFLDALDGSYCTYKTYGISGDTPGFDATYPDPSNATGSYKGQRMCGVYKPTNVISVSYGASEHDAPLNYTKRECNEFLKLGLQGVSILWASGDYGVASFPGDDTKSGCLGIDEKVYNPSFPTCPYITSVGATRLYNGQTINDKESAMEATEIDTGFSSTGGFANYFPVPKYQKSAADGYFAKYSPDLPYYYSNANATNTGAGGGIYNRVGRGLPDVSANGANFRMFNDLQLSHFFGTSLSAPIWGAIITLINQERTVIGKGPVGFLNPVLYENPWMFNDIVNGSNANCGSAGFKAVPGWDPVTGELMPCDDCLVPGIGD